MQALASTMPELAECALSRIGDRVSRHHLQQGAADLRQSAVGAGTVALRHGARAWRHFAAALAGRAQCSRYRRDRARLVVGFYGISAPKGTPPDIVDALNKAVGEALKDSKLVERLSAVGGIPKPMTPAEFGKLVSDETEKWRKVVEFAGVSVD